MRTIVGDPRDTSDLPDDLPNLKSHTVSFYAKSFAVWIAMGFRNATIEIKGKINA